MPDWIEEHLPDINEDDKKLLERFDTPAAAAQGFVDTFRSLSKRPVVPALDATESQVAEYRKQTGVPETHEGYEVPEAVTGGVRTLLEAVRPSAHKVHLTPAAFSSLATGLAEAFDSNAKELPDISALSDEWADSVRKELDADFDTSMALARRAHDKYFTEDQIQGIVDVGMRNNPGFFKALVTLGKQMADDLIPESSGDVTHKPHADAMPKKIAAKIREIMVKLPGLDQFGQEIITARLNIETLKTKLVDEFDIMTIDDPRCAAEIEDILAD